VGSAGLGSFRVKGKRRSAGKRSAPFDVAGLETSDCLPEVVEALPEETGSMDFLIRRRKVVAVASEDVNQSWSG
jgi:hypothetical protein